MRTMSLPRWLKVALAAYGVTLGAALLIYLALLFTVGHQQAERVWNPLPLTGIFIVALPIAARYLK